MNPAYLEDASGFRGYADALYVPADEAELRDVLIRASAASVPVTVAGAGTGVTGGCVAQGGWVLSLERFTRLEIGSGEAKAGAGVLLRDLHAAAARSGQFYPPDPTESAASVGGSVATNASGSRSFRYGATRAHVRALRVAFIDGTVREFARGERIAFDVRAVHRPATTKNTAGYMLKSAMDWVDLFVGSEGTLGIVTEARLNLLPAASELLTGVLFFESDAEALDRVDACRPRPHLRMLEYMDGNSLELLRPVFADIPVNARAAVLIEEEIQDDRALDDWAEAAGEDSWFAAGERDRERFRQFRHALPEAVNRIVRTRGLLKMGTDFAVPLDQNRAMLAFYREHLNREFPSQYVVFGHIGDAHLHVNILPRDGAEAERARDLILGFAREAVRRGGTVSAEHGLGKRKAGLLELQYTPDEIAAMCEVKHRLDPQWLLGRGTLLPPH